MNRVQLGIIGFGRIGAEHAGWLSRCGNIRATAAADITPARRQIARSMGLSVCESPDALLANGELDAVLISSPTASHFELASAALSAGKHVMIEKPMALDLPQAKRLIEMAKSAGRVLSVFHNRRWDADFLAVRAAIASGVFGKIINIESRLGQWASCVGPAAREFHPEWRNEAAYGGGGLLDWGSHFLDQIIQLIPNRPRRVFAQLRGNLWSRDCDDFARVVVDFENGTAALVEINTTTTRPLPRWHIDGTLGSASSPHSLEFDASVWAQLDFVKPDGSSQRLSLGEMGLNERQIWQKFADAILGNGQPAVTAESVLPVMALLDAARESSRTGIAIQLA
jgi:scyllo-inositol 2-dehydrogenase (NADP+)